MSYAGPQISFGCGFLALHPAGGGTVQVVVLKDISVDMTYNIKELVGNLQFPIDVTKGAGKITGKMKSGVINGTLINSILSGSTIATGATIGIYNEIHTASGASHQAVHTPFVDDCGVFNSTTGKWLENVGTQGSVDTGEYTVSSGGLYTIPTDNSVLLSYSYASSTGHTIALTNQLMGTDVKFEMVLFNVYDGKYFGIRLPRVSVPKLNMVFKNEDYTEQDMDFQACADASGKVVHAYTSE